MITLERTKELFFALKLHFTSKSYDFVKYNGKTRAQAVQQREKWSLERIARKYHNEDEMRNFFLTNMVHTFLKNGKIETFVGNYSTKESVEIYDLDSAWWNACSYNLTSDLRKLDSLAASLKIKDGELPQIFTEYLDGNISFNTIICIVLWKEALLKYWIKTCEDTILFGSYLKFLEKYLPLISKDKQKIKEILDKSLTN